MKTNKKQDVKTKRTDDVFDEMFVVDLFFSNDIYRVSIDCSIVEVNLEDVLVRSNVTVEENQWTPIELRHVAPRSMLFECDKHVRQRNRSHNLFYLYIIIATSTGTFSPKVDISVCELSSAWRLIDNGLARWLTRLMT
jgi:hypothetical protein